MTIPSLKLRWLNILKETDNSVDMKRIIQLILDETASLFSPDILNRRQLQPNSESEITANNFFDFKEDPSTLQLNCSQLPVENTQGLINNKIELELLKYLEDPRGNIEILEDYPLIKIIFMRYNTSLPSSAPVERLFSFATYINSPRRHALSDKLFEKLVLLKGNI